MTDRSARSRAPGAVACAALLLLGAASAAGAEREVLLDEPSEAILVLPLNVMVALPPDLVTPGPVVWEVLTAYLQDRGKRLKTASMRDARNLWRGAIRQVREEKTGDPADFDAAVPFFVQALAEHAEFAAVIAPSLFLRDAKVDNRKARWDGVSRSVRFEAATLDAKKLALLTRFEGVAPAASLHLLVLDVEGRVLQETLQGLELLVDVHVVRNPDEPFVYEPRESLFQDRDALRQAIAEALVPLVALPREP